jgi:amino acid adenylation domain-containing protein
VIKRHDVLRTAVSWEHLPRPVQVVHREVSLPVEEIALDRAREAVVQLRDRMALEHQRLELNRSPLIRLQVAADRDGSRGYVLMQLHHMVCDHESLDLMITEVMAHLKGETSSLSAPVPYRNHVAQALAHAQAHDAAAFFRGKLGDIDEPTAPFGLLDVHRDGSRTRVFTQGLDGGLTERIRSQARRLGVSTATLFHSVWALVVSGTSGRDDVVYGTVLSGRLQGSAGAERIMGMFINTLPLRLRLNSVTAKELVNQTQRELVELLDHEQASLAVAQRCSGVTGARPLFSALVNYRHTSVGLKSGFSSAPGINFVEFKGWTNYPLVLSVDDRQEGFILDVSADALIDPQRVLGYVVTGMQSLLEALERTPDALALKLPILPSRERLELIELFNRTDAAYPRERLVHELFEEQAARTPQSTALECGGRSLTYSELNAQANRLARYLMDQGVGPDRPVGVCVERSLEMVIGLLAALKAGGAYVPLDPDYPSERLAYMLQDARPAVVLTQSHLTERLPPSAARVITFDGDQRQIAAHSMSNPDPKALGLRSDHLAYVIYTSGSTGKPKGVMVEHRSVLSLWQGLEKLYRQSGPCQRVAVNASFNFDASVKQLIQLLSGRTLVLVPQQVRWDAGLWMKFIEESRIECTDCTPSQLRSWISAGFLEGNGGSLRMVLVGGEAIDPQLWNRLAQGTEIDFYNLYGPTESTVDTTAALLKGDSTGPHIGRPMENRRVYLLDPTGQPVPVGAAGEIYIGGEGVARGYLNRPELTAERFLPDPFSADPHARLYKTGDLGRWRAEGILEYLGRNDDQVKIRGFRIELGEIEAQLARYEQVREAAVVAWEEAPGEKNLVAYVVPRGQSAPGVEALQAHLKAALPEFMVPAAFVVLERLPLTPSGKLDRRALPAPELSAFVSREYEPPQGEMEELLAGVWQQLLNVERVGRNDNFFELGGHSLSAMRMLTHFKSMFSLTVPIRLLFEHPILSDLAGQIETMRHARVCEELSAAGRDVRRLLERVTALSDTEVDKLIKELATGGLR